MARIQKINKFEIKIERVNSVFFFQILSKKDRELYILYLFIFILFRLLSKSSHSSPPRLTKYKTDVSPKISLNSDH